ncbi:MAG: hypothetical protein ACSHW0_19360 [Thalassotalea sp.]
MNNFIALISFALGFVLIFPVYRYFYNSVFSNGDEYDSGFTKEFDKDATEAFTEDLYKRKRGIPYNNVQRFVYASLAVFIIPIILNTFISLGIYFILIWLF